MRDKQKVVLYLVAATLAFSICIYLIVIGILHVVAVLPLLFGCYPWYKYIWNVYNIERRNTIRILKKILPKSNFSIEQTDWNEEHTLLRFWGKYQGDNFMIEASPHSLYINVYDLPWHNIKSSDASMHRYMEAVNDTNAKYPHLCVVVCDPDENEMRDIYTLSRTILPDYHPNEYLDNLMCTMLNCKNTLAESLKRERPWLNSKRNSIGFNAARD